MATAAGSVGAAVVRIMPGVSEDFPNATLLYLGLCALSVVIIVGGSLGVPLQQYLLLSPALQSLLLGLAVSPALSVYRETSEFLTVVPQVLADISRLVIAIQLAATALSLPRQFVRRHWRTLGIMLGPVVAIMWATSSGLVLAFIPGINTWTGFLIGACLTPTDPVLASVILRGRTAEERLPKSLRDIISADSAINDGLVYPIVFLPLLMVTVPNRGEAIARWFYDIWAYGVLFSVVLGFTLGGVAMLVLLTSERYKLFDRQSYLVYSLALSLGVLGLSENLKTDSFLAVFTAAKTLSNNESASDRNNEAKIQDSADLIVTAVFFLAFGATLPYDEWADIGIWRLVALSLLLFLVRRLPAILLFKPLMPSIRCWPEAFFAGIFGPIGAAAFLYSVVAYDVVEDRVVLNVVSFVVLANVVLFSLTAPIGTALLARFLKWKPRSHAKDEKDDDKKRQKPNKGDGKRPEGQSSKQGQEHPLNDNRNNAAKGNGDTQPQGPMQDAAIETNGDTEDACNCDQPPQGGNEGGHLGNGDQHDGRRAKDEKQEEDDREELDQQEEEQEADETARREQDEKETKHELEEQDDLEEESEREDMESREAAQERDEQLELEAQQAGDQEDSDAE